MLPIHAIAASPCKVKTPLFSVSDRARRAPPNWPGCEKGSQMVALVPKRNRPGALILCCHLISLFHPQPFLPSASRHLTTKHTTSSPLPTHHGNATSSDHQNTVTRGPVDGAHKKPGSGSTLVGGPAHVL